MKQKINIKFFNLLSCVTVTACSQQIERNGISNDEKGPQEIVNQLRNDSEYTEKLKTVEDDDLVKALEKANIENVKDIADVVIKEVNGEDIKIISKAEIKKKTDIRRDRELKEFKVKSKIPVGRLKLNTKPIFFGSYLESKAFDRLAENKQNKEPHISYSEVSNANLCRAFYNVNKDELTFLSDQEKKILIDRIKDNVKTELINRGYDPESLGEDYAHDEKSFYCRSDKKYFYDYDDYLTLIKRMERFQVIIKDKYRKKGKYAILNEYKSGNFYIFDFALNMLNNPIKHLNLCFETYDDNVAYNTLAQNNEELVLESLAYADALVKDFRNLKYSFLSAKQDFENIKIESEQKYEQLNKELENDRNNIELQLASYGCKSAINEINIYLKNFEKKDLYFYHGLDIKFKDFLKNIYQVDSKGKFQQLLTPKEINTINSACYDHEHDKTDIFQSFVKQKLGNFQGKVILNPAFCSTSFSKKEVIDHYLGHETYPVFITIKIPKKLLKKYPVKFFYIDKQDLRLSNDKKLVHNTEKEMLLAAGVKLKITNIYGTTGTVNNHKGKNILAIEAEPYGE